MNSEEELIIKIFNSMNFASKSTSEDNSKAVNAQLNEIFKNYRKSKSFVKAVLAARKAQCEWEKFSALTKSNLLHRVWKDLAVKSKALPALQYNFSLLVDYFDLYTNLAAQSEKISAEPIGVVLVILPPQPCVFILGATVPAALAAGCSVVVHTDQAVIPLFLEEILINAGLPDGIFNVVTEPITDFNSISNNIQKTIYCGSFSAAQDFYFGKNFSSFNFFCPNNTAAIVLESCDLNAAVGNIFRETWEHPSFWAVSTVVVQESIIQKFLDKLKFQMEQFMNTTSNRSKFEDKKTLEKLNNVILEAVKAGAVVVKALYKENEWGPTALVNYQNQEEELPILKILVCRTPKEGVKLLNNCYSALGTSVWSELSVEALEIASQLDSSNIWINCHGIVKAQVPLSLTSLNGNLVFGGRSGILEYLSTSSREQPESKCESEKVSKRSEVLQTVLLAKKAFDSWHTYKNKRKYFKILADCLEKEKEYLDHAQTFTYLAFFANCPNFSEKNFTEEFFVVYEEVPVGIISLFISSEVEDKTLVFLIALCFALGNAVILVMERESSFVTFLINFFNKNIPTNLLTVVYGSESGLYLASDPNVQALWIYDEKVLTVEELQKESTKNLKHIWVIPKIRHLYGELLLKQCIKLKVIWQPKVVKFP